MIIYVAGWPRSGTTWLTRLIGDILDCPTGGAIPDIDIKEIATEGQNRPNKDFVVRKGHFKLSDSDDCRTLNSRRLPWKCLGNNRIALIIRDPRDTIISESHYWQIPFDKVIEKMFYLKYNEFMISWYNANLDNLGIVKYEELVESTAFNISGLLFAQLKLRPVPRNRLLEAVNRQSFKNRLKYTKENINNLPHGLKHYKYLRVGTSEQWKDHPEVERLAKKHFSSVMDMWGYK